MNWQPIATAPKDGTAVLVMRNNWPGSPTGRATACNGHNTYVAAWWETRWVCYMDAVLDPDCPIEPTHWMPLPPPPAAEVERPLEGVRLPIVEGNFMAQSIEGFERDCLIAIARQEESPHPDQDVIRQLAQAVRCAREYQLLRVRRLPERDKAADSGKPVAEGERPLDCPACGGDIHTCGCSDIAMKTAARKREWDKAVLDHTYGQGTIKAVIAAGQALRDEPVAEGERPLDTDLLALKAWADGEARAAKMHMYQLHRIETAVDRALKATPSPAQAARLEEIAREAHAETRRVFAEVEGRTSPQEAAKQTADYMLEVIRRILDTAREGK